jgi:hypothetical protein
MSRTGLLSVCLAFCSGCTGLIAGAGKDLGKVSSREEMHAVLGKPVASGVAEGKQYEEFRTRKVIAQDQTGTGEAYVIYWASTFGTIELIGVPYQLWLLGKRTLLGQTIRVTYEQDGAIGEVERDGQSVLGIFGRHRPFQEPQAGEAQAAESSAVSRGNVRSLQEAKRQDYR